MSIECFSLTKRYGNRVALKDFSAEIRQGKITGLVGPNGAGKSTLLKMITGLIYPTEGFVRIDGYDVHTEHKQAVQRLGAIVEWPAFYPDLSARRNLSIFSGGYGPAYKKKVEEVTSLLRINKVLDRKAGTFSTGMKQRLGIALALLPDSKYIILDEPVNGLDPEGIVEIRELILQCNRQAGITVLVSSHLLSEIEMICDEIIMISGGELKAAGNLKELLSSDEKIKIVSSSAGDAEKFLLKSFEQGAPWIKSLPSRDAETLMFTTSPETDPEMIADQLFRNGIRFSHFARVPRKLEDFYLNSSGQGDSK